MGAAFHFEHSLPFSAENAAGTLRQLPALPGVFALFSPRPEDQPYLTRAADLRRRVTRILAPPDSQSKRLNLRDRVARIEYTVTGSEFESVLCLYHASASLFGLDEARRRLKLRTPFFLRFAAENAYPRVYSTNRLSKRALGNFYGPFPSRAAADRYCDAVLDLFKLRRCYEDLAPSPDHPGCIYGEINKCLAPCNQACTPEGAAAYANEAEAVHAFFETHGESMLSQITAERERASEAMEFERAAELHAQHQKVKAAAALADELVQPVPNLRAIIVQKASKHAPTAESLARHVILSEAQSAESKDLQSVATPQRSETWVEDAPGAALPAHTEDEPMAAVFLVQAGCIAGPARLSTRGVRAVREQTAVGSSLFAQPLMIQAVPLVGEVPSASIPAPTPTESPEARASGLIADLEAEAEGSGDVGTLNDHLSILRRWYYRPEKQRAGEIFFPNPDGSWPIRRILNGAARAALGDPNRMADTQRDLATRNPAEPELKPTRTKVLHAGRPDVERVVPVVEKRATRGKREPD